MTPGHLVISPGELDFVDFGWFICDTVFGVPDLRVDCSRIMALMFT